MPEGVGYGPQSTFTGPSNSLIVIGKHAYAFGGVISVTDANDLLLSFQTGKEYLVSKITVSNSGGSGEDFRYTILLNGVIVSSWYFIPPNTIEMPLYLVIPPLTTVAIHGDNVSASTGRDHTAWLEGTIYK
jgi:hypothetical protein